MDLAKTFRSISLFILLFVTVACTSTGPVDSLATRVIDRAHTLPDGVAAWKTVAIVGRVTSSNDSTTIPPFPIPIFWEQAINDNLTLEWSPIPLSFRYQFSKTDTQMWGLNFGLGISWSNVSGLVLAPAATIISRSKLDQNFAIQAELGSRLVFGADSDFESGFSTDLVLSPMFQVSEVLALYPTLGLGVSKSAYSVGQWGFETSSDKMVATFPIGAGFDWFIARQWSLEGSYTYVKAEEGFSANLATFSLRHYW